MKKILNFCVVAALVVLAASCNRKVEFEHTTFATFGAVKYNVQETVGSLKVPVLLYNATGNDVQISLAVDATTAVEGVDFEIVSPANGLLSFSDQTDTLYVELSIKSMVGEFTGAKDFSLQIASATEGVSVGNYNTANVTIIDLDHPLAQFIGDWSGVMGGMYQNPSYSTTFNVSADPNDDTFTKLILSTGIDPFFHQMGLSNATYTAVASGNQIVVAAEQPNNYEDVVLLGFNNPDPSAADSYDHLRFELQEDGTLVQLNAYGAYTPGQGGFYEIYLGGAVFTKN